MPSRIPISDLEEINRVTGQHFIPVDDGETTNKITVENYNASANTTAQAYATAAANSATAAEGSASSASNTASEINNKLNQASTLVSNASTYASDASASASAAGNSATAANNSATAAGNSALSAEGSVASAEEKAMLAKSWAVGNSGQRADEAINNAKYWSEVARGAAGGGVTTFNSRFGAVVPANNDYTADMIQCGVDGNDEPIYVSDKLAELDTKCGTNADNITAVSGRVTTLEGRVTVLTATLTAGQTTLTFTSNKIGADSLITVMASVDGIEQPRKSVSGTTLTLTFEAMQSDVSIKVKIENY